VCASCVCVPAEHHNHLSHMFTLRCVSTATSCEGKQRLSVCMNGSVCEPLERRDAGHSSQNTHTHYSIRHGCVWVRCELMWRLHETHTHTHTHTDSRSVSFAKLENYMVYTLQTEELQEWAVMESHAVNISLSLSTDWVKLQFLHWPLQTGCRRDSHKPACLFCCKFGHFNMFTAWCQKWFWSI